MQDSRRITMAEVKTETKDGRPHRVRTSEWKMWAAVASRKIASRGTSEEILLDGEIVLEVRRCRLMEEIKRNLHTHAAMYVIDVDGCTYQLKAADYTPKDCATVVVRATMTT